MGSVKDLIILKSPKKTVSGDALFSFSDRYSVFDWGEMPDKIEGKGASICLVSSYFFEKLERNGIKTHYRGIGNKNTIMKVKLLRVIPPKIRKNTYDYSIYKKEKTNILIPLEIIYRNSLSTNSSVFKRIKEGNLKLKEFGLKKLPKAGTMLKKPLLDVSTKLETSDRYINFEEAQNIANLTNKELENIKKTTLIINEMISKEANKIGLTNEDGKVEFGFDENRNLILVDVVGTLDECRFTFNSMPVSKEVARIFYRNTKWHKNIEDAKKKDSINWKRLVKISPPPLPSKLRRLISMLYMEFANEITGKTLFKNTLPLKTILEEINEKKRTNTVY